MIERQRSENIKKMRTWKRAKSVEISRASIAKHLMVNASEFFASFISNLWLICDTLENICTYNYNDPVIFLSKKLDTELVFWEEASCYTLNCG